jgi:DnaK suppressor protein
VFKSLLLEKRKVIEKQLAGLKKKIKKSLSEDLIYERNSGDPDSDFITESSEIVKDEMMVSQLERNIAGIDEALDGIKHGAYGECKKCGEPIDPARLKTVPWTKYCYRCQSEMENLANHK